VLFLKNDEIFEEFSAGLLNLPRQESLLALAESSVGAGEGARRIFPFPPSPAGTGKNVLIFPAFPQRTARRRSAVVTKLGLDHPPSGTAIRVQGP